MPDVTTDLNATITNAVLARVEAEVTAALAGDAVIGKWVASALNQPIEKDYGRVKTTWLRQTLTNAFREMTTAAIGRILEEERALIEDEIRKSLRRNASQFASQITQALADKATKGYRFNVELQLPANYE